MKYSIYFTIKGRNKKYQVCYMHDANVSIQVFNLLKQMKSNNLLTSNITDVELITE